MEIKAKDMCPRCKYCLGMTPQGMYSCGKTNDGSELNIGIDVVLNCANFEWKDGKVEGKVSDWCPKCKNCKGTTQESNGVHVWLTEVECEDPYDGMIKTLAADSDICCSLFEPKKEKEPFNLNMSRKQLESKILDLFEEKNRLNGIINILEKEKAAHMKGIERLKKSNEKFQNQIKNLQITNEESYKREEKLEEKLKKANELADSWKRDYEFVRDQLIHPIYDILYPDIPNRDINVTDFINNVKDLKVYEDENKSMYEDLKYWRERCHGAETDVTTLNSKVEVLEKKLQKADSIRDAVGNESKLNQTISDQEVTIKALLITIKEMCKEDETNE